MVVVVLGLCAILYGAWMALVQVDFRRLLAYSSVSHLGFVVVGLFALNYQGLQGSLLTMINLGFSTAGLFFIAGFLYSRQQTTQLSAFGGMAKQVPLLATFFLIIGLASIGLPGTNGFVGEFLILLGAFKAKWWFGADCRSRGDFRRSIFSLVLRAFDVGTAGCGSEGDDDRSATAREDHCRVTVCHDSLDRALSVTVPTHHERIGSSTR